MNRRAISYWLWKISVTILVTIINVFVGMSVGGYVLFNLLSQGVQRYVALGLASLVAIGLHFYILYNHKIRFISEDKEPTK
jgi:hypothetical protein